MSARLLVVTALRTERAALPDLGPHASVERCGMGPVHLRRWAERRDQAQIDAAAVAGLAGGLATGMRTGDLVVASEVRDGSSRVALPAAAPLAAELKRRGFRVHVGPIVSTDHLVTSRAELKQLADEGAIAVDMESAGVVRELRRQYGTAPLAVLRVVVDTVEDPLTRVRTAPAGVVALRALRRAVPSLRAWADLTQPRTVLLAGPRSFCAGVERAIDIVERALDRYPHPVYVRRQIVHNAHVIDRLRSRGAEFVTELDEVPDGSRVIFSAHGVAPSVRAEAARRDLLVIDATCPLVAKVHTEARRFAGRGQTVLLVGHAGHDEVEGTLGEDPDRIVLVGDTAAAETVAVDDPNRVAFVLQTTLGADEAAETVAVLRRRFPLIDSSPTDDICYATTNRQQAVAALAPEADVVLVVGSSNSSNSLRLVEVAKRHGTPAYLIEDAGQVLPEWLRGADTIGITAGASAPPHLVDELVDLLRSLGPLDVVERVVAREDLTFALPKGVVG